MFKKCLKSWKHDKTVIKHVEIRRNKEDFELILTRHVIVAYQSNFGFLLNRETSKEKVQVVSVRKENWNDETHEDLKSKGQNRRRAVKTCKRSINRTIVGKSSNFAVSSELESHAEIYIFFGEFTLLIYHI